MKSKIPLLLLMTVWFTLLSLPPLAQHSKPPTTAARTHHTRHHHRPTKKKSVIVTSIKVWVNTNSGVYHYPGMRWYGNTNSGEYMSEDEARKRGYRATMNGQ